MNATMEQNNLEAIINQIQRQNKRIQCEKKALQLFAQTIADDATAVEVAELYPEWDGNGVAYAAGIRTRFNGKLYKCLLAHTSQPGWAPASAPSLWVATADPAEEWPLIPNPIPSSSPWMAGQKGRTADGRRWISKIDNNVWQPEAYPAGWEAQA